MLTVLLPKGLRHGVGCVGRREVRPR